MLHNTLRGETFFTKKKFQSKREWSRLRGAGKNEQTLLGGLEGQDTDDARRVDLLRQEVRRQLMSSFFWQFFRKYELLLINKN